MNRLQHVTRIITWPEVPGPLISEGITLAVTASTFRDAFPIHPPPRPLRRHDHGLGPARRRHDLSHGLQETTLFKRDDVLGPRDLELADAHGVNLTEMNRHSLMKRDDGDHVTIWVARNYIAHDDGGDSTEAVDDDDVDEEDLTKRQSVRVGKDVFFHRGALGGKTCLKHKRQSHTGPNRPTSGGVQAFYRWGDREAGSFMLHSRWQSLVIAGSNKGANALYRASETCQLLMRANYEIIRAK
ncbi:Transcription factor atf1 [Verticillium dahliae VDG1]|nr:Transcription factor atf1 [Verticillium dahliae VDG1]